MVELIPMDAACAGNNEVSIENVTSPCGLWLMVSYGKQGNKNYKGKKGRNGFGNSGAAESMEGVGKTVGKDDIMMTECELQGVNKASGSANHKGKVVLTEITNYTGRNFWQQKSRNCWLKEGDRNTKFFHISTIIRRRRNKIKGFKKEDGNWIRDIGKMKKETINYFLNFFEMKQSHDEYSQLPMLFLGLKERDISHLSSSVCENDIKMSLFNIGGIKALGPNGRPNQVAFLPGKLGYIAWKIDLAKAYDKLQWGFIKLVLEEVGIVRKINDLIMSCITNVSYKVVVNGELTESFIPKFGIRQGDHLSPYIFMLCMEKLSHIIKQKLFEKSWKSVKISKGGPDISHIFFANDLILFWERASSASSNHERLS
ncbi:hypothetical protein Dsin_006640 [Dipteronia sinensis]|uniref:Reverse transcriptase domain-containing protein n=1 Tax=Dipteronia sinensis TaxID=43782 RepID=A0AAE0EFR6_9ROSI|nr:hypothetical protein Dsin_006640 [Dipteronia sinensis]